MRGDGRTATRRTDVARGGAVPILMYHQVTPTPLPEFRKYAVTTDAFAAQLDWLAARSYVPVSMAALSDYRSGRGQLPTRPVILTFDDGYRDCLEYAVPILKSRGFTATFYVLGRLAGQTSRWLLAERGIEYPLMNWDDVRELRAAGNECGSHSMSHPRLSQLSPDACREELADSRKLIEDKLGTEIRHLAYPFGDYDERVRAIAVESGYETACSVRPGWSRPDDDLFALHRVHVPGSESLKDFAAAFRSRRSARELLKAAARSMARRLGVR